VEVVLFAREDEVNGVGERGVRNVVQEARGLLLEARPQQAQQMHHAEAVFQARRSTRLRGEVMARAVLVNKRQAANWF
jgi:hypothetical protein